MKKITSLVSLGLSLLLSLTTLGGCGRGKKPPESSSPESPEITTPEETQKRGTHERSVEQTSYDLIKNGSTDYIIVISNEEKDDEVLFAVDELRQNFFNATSINLSVVTDKNASFSVDATYLSVGETALLQQAEISLDKVYLGQSGYIVKTAGKSVFMVGGSGFGTLYAVYGWLKEQFNYAYYAIDAVTIDQEVVNEKLLNVSIVEKPDFAYRLANTGETTYNQTHARRLRVSQTNDIWINLGGLTYHNSFNVVPPEVYKAAHPNWYSEDGEQLCYTRDPEGLAAVVVEEMKKALIAEPNKNILTFTQQDYNSWCTCASCTASKQRYGTDSAGQVLFINRVSKEVGEWVDREYPGREVIITTFAYQKSLDAPVVETENGYEAVDPSLKLNDNVAILFAPINAHYYYDFYSELNRNDALTMEKWAAIAKHIFLWSYGTNFKEYFIPYNNFNAVQNLYRFAYDNGAKYIFDQYQHNQSVGTDWYRLRAYLAANLQWEIDADKTRLVEDFFANYFVDASQVMLKIFNEQNTWFAYLAEHHAYTGETGGTKNMLLKPELWPQGMIEGWLKDFDKAYALLEPLRDTNLSLYNTLSDRITLESISFRYIQYELYGTYYSESETNQMRESLNKDCKRLGISHIAELRELDNYFANN